MNDQELYDHALDTPASSASDSPVPVPTLPDEPYYQQPAPRRSARNASLGIALVLVGLVLLAFQVFGRSLPIDNGRSIPLIDKQLAGNRIELSVAASDVEVRSWTGSDIRVEATQRGGERGDYNIDVSTSGGTVRVAESSRNFFCLFCSRHVSYQISVPNGAQADIKTASGDITVEGLNGAVALSTVSGEIQAHDLQGGLTAGTTSGEVRLNNVLGKLEVNTISGDVQLEDGKVDGATVNTTSGEVDLDGVSGALNIGTVSGDVAVRDAHNSQLAISTTSGSFEYSGDLAKGGSNAVNSISGDVKLALPQDAGIRLDASTISGSISNDIELNNREEGLRSLKGVAGDGATNLTIGTTSGSISIEQR
jgi:DUF4097 and DUF4098 domain-containing protein YvlB